MQDTTLPTNTSNPITPSADPLMTPTAPPVPATTADTSTDDVQDTVPTADLLPQQTQNRFAQLVADDQQSDDSVPVSAPADPTTPADETKAEGEEEKSPLEILEEILAGANAEQDTKDKEAAEKEKKEAEEKAAFAAKEAAFAQQTQTKLAETKVKLEEAKVQREKVEQEILVKDGPATQAMGDQFAIHQLTHDTIQATE